MKQELRLKVLKKDLQISTGANDDYLEMLLTQAEERIAKEGIEISKKEENMELEMAVIQYAAYLFRKRASKDSEMPRYLRYGLNNILFSQKAKGVQKKNDA